jgi:hypothetical protein
MEKEFQRDKMIVRQKSKGKRELLNLQSSINYGNVPYKKKKKKKKKNSGRFRPNRPDYYYYFFFCFQFPFSLY